MKHQIESFIFLAKILIGSKRNIWLSTLPMSVIYLIIHFIYLVYGAVASNYYSKNTIYLLEMFCLLSIHIYKLVIHRIRIQHKKSFRFRNKKSLIFPFDLFPTKICPIIRFERRRDLAKADGGHMSFLPSLLTYFPLEEIKRSFLCLIAFQCWWRWWWQKWF